jgi:radical SAM protein with 4Fe4S-binding SPASM domain
MYRNMARTQHYPYKELKNLITQLKDIGTKGIVFCGGGEPTLYPQLKEIVEFIKKCGLDFGILTNGSMLKKYGKLLVDNSRFIRITIDSVDAENYKKIHNPPKNYTLHDTLENVVNIVDYRERVKSKCNIGIKSLISQGNMHERHEMDVVFNSLGVDYVHFKYARDCVGEIKEGKTELKCKCFMSPIQVQIDAYGDVYVCCFYQYRFKTHKFGNVLDKSFRDVWFSSEHYKAIQELKIKECNVYDCKLHEYNNFMNEVLTKDPLHINFF